MALPFRIRIIAAFAGLVCQAAIPADEPPPPRPSMISEAKLPEGFPPPGPVGQVIVKTYPAHRMARTSGDAAGGDNRMFMKLFGHIKRNEIAMTAPVTMDWSGDPAVRKGPESMAFLYASPDLGASGPDPADPAVTVEDIPEMKVVSVGVRGSYGEKTFRNGHDAVEAWLDEHPEWTADGPPRMLAYNSPFVPGFMKYAEVQVPVRPTPPPSPQPAK
jgi:hypothetical protein